MAAGHADLKGNLVHAHPALTELEKPPRARDFPAWSCCALVLVCESGEAVGNQLPSAPRLGGGDPGEQRAHSRSHHVAALLGEFGQRGGR